VGRSDGHGLGSYWQKNQIGSEKTEIRGEEKKGGVPCPRGGVLLETESSHHKSEKRKSQKKKTRSAGGGRTKVRD